jgi:hypothetical protein
MSCPIKQELAAIFVAISLTLNGCDFGTSQDRKDCNGGACDCQNNYYGMEAGMYIGGVPIEHASLHVTIPRAEPDTENSTGCCSALYDLHPVRERGVNIPGPSQNQNFCKSCAKAPNAELSNAAKSCSAPAALRSFSSSRARPVLTSNDEDINGSASYSDCQIAVDAKTISLLNGKNVTGVKTNFNIRWTDLANSSSKPCCTALSPLIHRLYFNGGDATQSEWQGLCNACKTAFNPGVGLAAFRSCGHVSSGPAKQTVVGSPAGSVAEVASVLA